MAGLLLAVAVVGPSATANGLRVALPSTPVPTQAAADALSQRVVDRHLHFGQILDPIFAAPPGQGDESTRIVGYTHAGDAAIWTGHFLAAEAYRYRVTRDPRALANVREAVAGLKILADVTSNGLLPRVAIPADWEFAQSVLENEVRPEHTYRVPFRGRTWIWIGETSRDQYSGVFFGLGAAYESIDDPAIRADMRYVSGRLLDYLTSHSWTVSMPDGSISTTFIGHPDQRLAFLAVGRLLDPNRFNGAYNTARILYSATAGVAIYADLIDIHNSYAKYNLDSINLFNLVRTEGNKTYRGRYKNVYDVLRRTTDDHGNAHFNMIDRVINGPNAARDAETVALLGQWLERPDRDPFVDLRGDPRYPACGEVSCVVIPVVDRVRTDFLWQRDPFLLFGGGNDTVETPGLDYTLPYWMARAYGVLSN